MEDFLDEVRLAFTHIADAYTEEKDQETAHIHLIKSHCDGRAKKYIRLLPKRKGTKAADLIAALKSAFDNADEDERREVRAHGAMLELKQRRDALPAKYARHARRIAALAASPTISTRRTKVQWQPNFVMVSGADR